MKKVYGTRRKESNLRMVSCFDLVFFCYKRQREEGNGQECGVTMLFFTCKIIGLLF